MHRNHNFVGSIQRVPIFKCFNFLLSYVKPLLYSGRGKAVLMIPISQI